MARVCLRRGFRAMAVQSVWEVVVTPAMKLGLGFLALALASSFMVFGYGIFNFFNLLNVRIIFNIYAYLYPIIPLDPITHTL